MGRAARSSATKRGIESGKREKAARKAEKRKAPAPATPAPGPVAGPDPNVPPPAAKAVVTKEPPRL